MTHNVFGEALNLYQLQLLVLLASLSFFKFLFSFDAVWYVCYIKSATWQFLMHELTSVV